MFIKKTIKKDLKTGKPYITYHLVESVRTDRGPRQRTLLYLGSEISLPEEDHKALANRIEEIITGQQSFFSYPEQIEQLAQSYASRLVRRLSDTATQDISPIKESDFQTVDVTTIEHSEPRTVGTEHLLLQMANQLAIPKQLRALGLSKQEVILGLASIIARAANPASERATYNWLVHNSGIGELLDFDFNKVFLKHLYAISDVLLKHKDALESYLEITEQSIHGYKSTIAIYDLTNTYMEGQAKSNPKASHGRSKEKRTDCPLVTLGIVSNEHGFIQRTSILPGKASEPKTLEEMINALGYSYSLFKPIIILDAGIATEANLQWLREREYQYVVSARQKAPSLEIESELVPVGDLKNNVQVALIRDDQSGERWLYCESKAKTAVSSQIRDLFTKRLEEDLNKVKSGLSKPKGRKKYTKVLERISRIKEKHKRISGCYEINLIPSEDGATATAIEWKVIPEKIENRLTGRYFLRTNIIDVEAKELWELYNSLRTIEDVFRFMKASLGMRPVYHQKEHRVDGHLWITILAYHLIQNCLYQLKKEGINDNWETVRACMSSRVRVTTEAKTQDGKMIYHRSTTRAEEQHKRIYKATALSGQILKAKRMIA